MNATIIINHNNGIDTFTLKVGVQYFKLAYENDGSFANHVCPFSAWYAGQLKIALTNAGCKNVEIVEQTH